MLMAAEAPRKNFDFEQKIRQVWKKLTELYDFTTLPVLVPVPSIRAICESIGIGYNDFKNEMAKIGVIETESRSRWDPIEKKAVRHIMFFSAPVVNVVNNAG